jgi:alpha-N-arabinofuranosidase
MKVGKEVVLISTQRGIRKELAKVPITSAQVFIKVDGNNTKATFFAGETEKNLQPIGENVSIEMLCDEVAFGFSGPYIGMYATSNGQKSKAIASFDWFEYSAK